MQSHVSHALLPDRSPNGSTERVLRDAVTLIDTARAKNLSVPHR
jgi:hypothetical protein